MTEVEVMQLLYTICFGVFGIVVGSFLNVCIYRIPRNISVLSGNKGRSMCTHCGHRLGAFDMIPVLSFLFLKGKCRYCHEKVSARYPAVELINCILWVLAAWKVGTDVKGVIYCLFFSVLLVLAYIDWDTQEIPYRLQLAILVLGCASLLVPGFPGLKQRILGMIIITVPMAVGALFNGFGGGDVQLMFTSGFLLGWKVMIVAAFIAVTLGAVHGVIALKKRGKKIKIAFGPYLSIGLILSAIWGNQVVEWYLGYFF